ncbi:hypothetical protein [Pseudomonas sp. PSPC3-3]|uniref:hypothetical protein n=1 Tax=unclassified Pseudomonas TaxID=196821 RepID=UPI003CF3AA8C
MDPGNVSAIISAVAGISGVLLGNSFVAIKEWWTNRNKVNQATTYLGIIVVSHLERFATGCLEVSLDDGTSQGQPAGEGGQYVTTTTAPLFHPLELDVDWRLLPKYLMYSVLRLPDQQDQLHGRLGGIMEFNYDPPDHADFFWARRRGYAVLGLQASDIAKNLRSHAGLPADKHHPGEWSRDQNMRDVIAHLDALEKSILRNANPHEL